jgi:hypothetical protein
MNTDRIIEAMNTQPTPETDSAYIQRPNEGAWDFRVRQEKTMEKLERERDEWKEKYIQQNKDLGCELRDPNGTIWDHAKTLQSEVEYLKSQLTQTQGCVTISRNGYVQELERERDEAREIIAAALKALPVGYLPAHTPESIPARIEDLCETIVETERELAEVTEQRDGITLRLGQTQERMIDAERQRDRLAEALRKWDAACAAAEKCNAYQHSEQFKYRQWKTLSNRHERLLADAESEKNEVLALIDSRKNVKDVAAAQTDAQPHQTACSPSPRSACSMAELPTDSDT